MVEVGGAEARKWGALVGVRMGGMSLSSCGFFGGWEELRRGVAPALEGLRPGWGRRDVDMLVGGRARIGRGSLEGPAEPCPFGI